jgi:GDP/UDP-N,N'-diacetylbacillosamine 2-epimerase (hydrolysing)
MKLAVITGSRADFGLLTPLLTRLKTHPRFELQLIACAGHLVPTQGLTLNAIKTAGFTPVAEIDMLLASNSPQAISKAIGLGILSFTDIFMQLKPEALLVLGDRFEILAAATAALVLNIPLIHLEGGQITQGAMDEAIRHAVSKMSHLHFTACETYRARLITMGERPETVFNVGATGVENIATLSTKPLRALSKEFAFDFSRPFLLITLHSETATKTLTAKQMAQKLCAALAVSPLHLVFTGSNADAGGEVINAIFKDFVAQDPEKRLFHLSLGHENYLSLARHAQCVVGNSSSGLIEIPSLGVPTLNIGTRQKGRLLAKSVITCDFETIDEGLSHALSPAHVALAKQATNPLQQENTSLQIITHLEQINFSTLQPKVFYDVF